MSPVTGSNSYPQGGCGLNFDSGGKARSEKCGEHMPEVRAKSPAGGKGGPTGRELAQAALWGPCSSPESLLLSEGQQTSLSWGFGHEVMTPGSVNSCQALQVPVDAGTASCRAAFCTRELFRINQYM